MSLYAVEGLMEADKTNLSPEIIIEPNGTAAHYWRDLWRYRELLYFLAWRDTLVRYKQTVIGVAWSVIRPLLTMIIFTLVFSRIAQLPSNGAPYPLMVLAAMIPWQFFTNALSESSGSLMSNSHIVTKVYFPRLIAPISSIFVSLVDFFISLALLVPFLFWYHVNPGFKILYLPVLAFATMFVATSCGIWLSALIVKYRDFRFIVPFMLQLGLFISPVGFSSEIVPAKWQVLYYLNPMAGIIELFRWMIMGGPVAIQWNSFVSSMALTVFLMYTGLVYFRKTERTLVDMV